MTLNIYEGKCFICGRNLQVGKGKLQLVSKLSKAERKKYLGKKWLVKCFKCKSSISKPLQENTMDKKITQLLSAFGYELQDIDELNKRFRYKSEENFVDIWNGKRGITIAVYNEEMDDIKYKKSCSLQDIEEAICG